MNGGAVTWRDMAFHALTWTVVILSVAGCRGNVKDPHRGKFIVVESKGESYRIPPTLTFDDQEWTREYAKPVSESDGVSFDYVGQDPNVKVRLHLMPVSSGTFTRTVDTLRRKDQQSRWRRDGKCLRILKSGVWREWSVDADRSGQGNGVYRYSYENGKIKYVGRIEDDFDVGMAQGFYPDGALWWEGEYVDSTIAVENARFFARDGSRFEHMSYDEKRSELEKWKTLAVDRSEK
ncbi:hypothetical protein [Bremerella cremea]|uniref:toxin-antitoxin system YwqK family antitoxin n=1 Tax=Bremerella cremea TaxID=1031537 RepID=UPI0031E67AF9